MLVSKLLAFVFSPGGKLLLGALALTVWTHMQRLDATKDCKEDQLRVELEETNRKLELAAEISKQAQLRAERSAEELLVAEKEKDEILKELQASGSSCAIPDSIRERLRAIK